MDRIKVVKQENGQYKAYSQSHMGGDVWFDSHYCLCGVGDSIGEAIANLRKEMHREIAYIECMIEESYTCDIVDGNGEWIGRASRTMTINELLNLIEFSE